MKDVRLYLADIRERIAMIESFTQNGRAEFFNTLLIQEGTIRSLEVIGEIIKRLPSDVIASHADVAWRDLARMRDVLIHQYDRIGLETVWDTVQNDLPALKVAIQALLDEMSEEPPGDETPEA